MFGSANFKTSFLCSKVQCGRFVELLQMHSQVRPRKCCISQAFFKYLWETLLQSTLRENGESSQSPNRICLQEIHHQGGRFAGGSSWSPAPTGYANGEAGGQLWPLLNTPLQLRIMLLVRTSTHNAVMRVLIFWKAQLATHDTPLNLQLFQKCETREQMRAYTTCIYEF